MTYYLMLFLLAGFFLCRNHSVYRVGVAILQSPDWLDTYFQLPRYDAMLWNPKYWLLWTESDWRAWVARQPKVSA